MKNKLLKSLLLVTAMLLGLNVNAQQIRAKWTVPASDGLCSIYTATGYGNKLYGSNYQTGKIEEWENGELIASYDVNAFCVTNNLGEDVQQEDESMLFQYYELWNAIMVDDAGNLLVNVRASTDAANTCQNWILLPANDRTKMQLLHINEFPSADVTIGRIDVPSRMVGNITDGGAYMYITPHSSIIMPVMFVSTDNDGNIYFDKNKSWALPLETNITYETTVATFKTFEELKNATSQIEFATDTYIRARTHTKPYTWDSETSQFKRNSKIPQGAGASGMDVFKLAGAEFIIIPIKSPTTGNRGSSIGIYNIATGEMVASWDAGTTTDYIQTSIEAQVNEDGKSANIYVCGKKDCFGILEFTVSEIENIYITNNISTLKVGEFTKLEVIIQPDNATNKTLSWSSSDESIATVSSDGTVTAISDGTVIITATTTDGTNLSASQSITVITTDIISNGIEYNITPSIEANTVEVIKGNYTGDVVIPGEVTIEDQTYTVSSIGESAFADCTEITSVSIPKSISAIANTAFDGCTGLELLDMSESTALTSISSNTFSTCTALETVNFPTSIESIGASAFANCANLSNMSLPCTTPPVLDNENNPFEGVDATACIISIPTESVSEYTQSESWNKFVDSSCKSDIQISVVNNESESENNCIIRFKKLIENTIEPAELMANNIKAILAEEEVVSEETPDAVTANGQSLFVANGDAVTFYIIPDEATEIDKVIYNETDVTQQVVENTFTTPEVNTKSSLQVILKNGTPTGVEDNFIEKVDVEEMARYDISGRLLSSPVKGVNIVKMSDGTMKKVIVK